MSNKTLSEKEAELRRLVVAVRDACLEKGITVNPAPIDPKKTISTCTLPELLAHLLFLFERYDMMDHRAHPRKAHHHLDCIGVCIKCIPVMQ